MSVIDQSHSSASFYSLFVFKEWKQKAQALIDQLSQDSVALEDSMDSSMDVTEGSIRLDSTRTEGKNVKETLDAFACDD